VFSTPAALPSEAGATALSPAAATHGIDMEIPHPAIRNGAT
jgi:hypothetical protein